MFDYSLELYVQIIKGIFQFIDTRNIYCSYERIILIFQRIKTGQLVSFSHGIYVKYQVDIANTHSFPKGIVFYTGVS